MQRLYRPRARRWRIRATLKAADAKAIQSKGRRRKGRRRTTIKTASVDAIQIKCPQREEMGDHKDSGCRG